MVRLSSALKWRPTGLFLRYVFVTGLAVIFLHLVTNFLSSVFFLLFTNLLNLVSCSLDYRR